MSRAKMIRLIKELREAPATVYELSASAETGLDSTRRNIDLLRAAGLVQFCGYADGKHGRHGQRASKWAWVR